MASDDQPLTPLADQILVELPVAYDTNLPSDSSHVLSWFKAASMDLGGVGLPAELRSMAQTPGHNLREAIGSAAP